jgi:hypothetical protein
MKLAFDNTAALADNQITQTLTLNGSYLYFSQGTFFDRDFELSANLKSGELTKLELNTQFFFVGGSKFLVGPNNSRMYCGVFIPHHDLIESVVVKARFTGISIDIKSISAAQTPGLAGINLGATFMRLANSFKYEISPGVYTTKLETYDSLSGALVEHPLLRVTWGNPSNSPKSIHPEHTVYSPQNLQTIRQYRGISESHPAMILTVRELTKSADAVAWVEAFATPDNGATWEKFWTTEEFTQAGQQCFIPPIPDDREIKVVYRNKGSVTRSAISLNIVEHFPSDLKKTQIFDYNAAMTSTLAANNETETFRIDRCQNVRCVVVQQSGDAGSTYGVLASDSSTSDFVEIGTITIGTTLQGSFTLQDNTYGYFKIRCKTRANNAVNKRVGVVAAS